MFSIVALSSPFIFAIEAWWPMTFFLLCYNVVGILVKENIGFKHKDYVM